MKHLIFCLVTFLVGIPLHAQWVKLSGPTGFPVTSLVVSGTKMFAGSLGGGVYRSMDNGTSWIPLNSLSNKSVSALAVSGPNLFAGTVSGIFMSSDWGETWNAVNKGLGNNDIEIIYLSANEIGVFVSTMEGACTTCYPLGAFRFVNKDSGWSALDFGLGKYHTVGPIISSKIGLLSFAAGFRGVQYLYFSGDSGKNWKTDSSIIPVLPNVLIEASATTQTNAVFIAGYHGIAVTTNTGSSWTIVNGGLANTNVVALVKTSLSIFAGTHGGGVFRTTNYGENWEAWNVGLTNMSVVSLATTDTHLFAGTTSEVWRRPLSEMTTVESHSDVLPKIFSLEQNYPNPFNPSTTIRYALPSFAHVRMTIHDILGREIATLVNEEQSAGWKEVEWNAGGVSSGIYFYKIIALQKNGGQAGNYVGVKKLMMLK